MKKKLDIVLINIFKNHGLSYSHAKICYSSFINPWGKILNPKFNCIDENSYYPTLKNARKLLSEMKPPLFKTTTPAK